MTIDESQKRIKELKIKDAQIQDDGYDIVVLDSIIEWLEELKELRKYEQECEKLYEDNPPMHFTREQIMWIKEHIKHARADSYELGRADAIDEIERAMYHEAFEVSHEEDGMQKWESGNWIRYKLFEIVIEKLKE